MNNEQYKVHAGYEVSHQGNVIEWTNSRIEAEDAYKKAFNATMFKHDGLGTKKVVKTKSHGFKLGNIMKEKYSLHPVYDTAWHN